MAILDFLMIAIRQAEKTYGYRSRHGCVIVNGKELVSKGHNKRKHTPKLYKYGYKRCWLHAESDAILKAECPRKLWGADLLVIRVGKTKLSNSKPCIGCMSMIKEVGIRRVIYSDIAGVLQTIEMKK